MTKLYRVRVHFPARWGLEAFTHDDGIYAASPLDAIKRSIWNWPDAEWVELI